MQKEVYLWLKFGLINLGIVALIGCILRYKIAFSLPFIDQKNLLHGHSHFAFSGWISHVLMTLLVYFLTKRGLSFGFSKYKWLLIGNLISAYGMLFSFPIQGYGPVSIFFSTFSVLVSYVFAFVFWKDINQWASGLVAGLWFKAALFFYAISSAGTIYLAYSLTSNHFEQKTYLASVYFYLHFQYNGWFFFACMGLLWQFFESKGIWISRGNAVFTLFLVAAFPAYFLSILWWPLPDVLVFTGFLSAFLQLMAWGYLVRQILLSKNDVGFRLSGFGRNALILSALALSVKLLLQLGSTYPPLSQLAFGFRPIVIGYLHLVLLGVITLFLLGFMASSGLIRQNSLARKGLRIFVVGILANEFLLMGQGIAALDAQSLPMINELLLLAALVLLSGISLLAVSQFHVKSKQPLME